MIEFYTLKQQNYVHSPKRSQRNLFQFHGYLPIDALERKNKIQALEAYYSQKHRTYLNSNFIKSLATTRGVQIGSKYAEAFEVIRWIIA